MADFTPKVAFLLIILGILRSVSAVISVAPVRGFIASAFTSVKADAKLNLCMIPPYAKYLKENGLDGVLISGIAGECNKFSLEERKKVLEAWVLPARDNNLTLTCQVSGSSLADAKELARYAEKLGVNALMTLPELLFWPSNVEQLVYYLRCIASAAPNTPLYYHHAPDYTGIDLDMVQFVASATDQIYTFKGIKTEDCGVAFQLRTKMKADQTIFIANTTDVAPAAAMGFTDYILTSLNIVPCLIKTIVSNMQSCELEKGRANDEILQNIVNTIISQGREEVPAMKRSLYLIRGIDVGPARDPEIPLSEREEQQEEAALRQLGILPRCCAQE